MTTEDITEIITRRLDAIVKELGTVNFSSDRYFNLCERFDELTQTMKEILALKEKENEAS